jgi:hypothetical protein
MACSTNGNKRNAYRVLVGKSEGKIPLGRPKRRWVDNIKIDLRQTGWADTDWIDLAQDRNQWRTHVNIEMSFRVPLHYRIVDACETIRNYPGVFERTRSSMMRHVEA